MCLVCCVFGVQCLVCWPQPEARSSECNCYTAGSLISRGDPVCPPRYTNLSHNIYAELFHTTRGKRLKEQLALLAVTPEQCQKTSSHAILAILAPVKILAPDRCHKTPLHAIRLIPTHVRLRLIANLTRAQISDFLLNCVIARLPAVRAIGSVYIYAFQKQRRALLLLFLEHQDLSRGKFCTDSLRPKAAQAVLEVHFRGRELYVGRLGVE